MVTLVHPLDSEPYVLWRLVWSNVPEGEPTPGRSAQNEALPWLRADSGCPSNDEIVTPDMSHPAEAFFGMPRRLRLINPGGVADGGVAEEAWDQL